MRALIMAMLCGAPFAVLADTEHDRIAAQRKVADAKLAEQERACNTQFVVSGCLDTARKEHRATMTRLRHEELDLDDARRQAKVAARRKELADKASAQATKEHEATMRDEPTRHEVRPPSAFPAVSAPSIARPAPYGQPSSGVSRAEQERINTEKFEARQRQAEAHRAEVERRNLERSAQGKDVAPLPTPASAAR